jgi:thiamine pyrophosphate-dependent acetolactate synthase large subunit-like protein
MSGNPKAFPLRRRAVVRQLIEARADLLVVTGLGSASWDAAAVGDRDLTFPLWGAMGGAASLALGLALAQPRRRVLAITGDGEMLMGLTALTTIGALRPANLGIAVLDNEHYGETGGQRTNTGRGSDIAAIARASGIEDAGTVRAPHEVEHAVAALTGESGPVLRVFKVRMEELPLVMPPKDGALLRDRFRRALEPGRTR